MKARQIVFILIIASAVIPSHALQRFSFAPVWEVTAPLYSCAAAWNPVTGNLLVSEWDNPSGTGYQCWVFSSVDGSSTGVKLNLGGLSRADFFSMAVTTDGQIYGQLQVTSIWGRWASETATDATAVTMPGWTRNAKIIGVGNSMRLCSGGMYDGDQCRVWGTTDNGFTWSQVDLLPLASGKSIHVENAGSTVAFSGGAWESDNDLKRYTRVSSATDGSGWVRDTAFAPTMFGDGFPHTGDPFSADYDEDDNLLITMGYTNDQLCLVDGTTGEIIAAATAQNDFTYYGNVTIDAAHNRAYFMARDTAADADHPHSYLACWQYPALPTPTPTNTPIIAGTSQWSEYR